MNTPANNQPSPLKRFGRITIRALLVLLMLPVVLLLVLLVALRFQKTQDFIGTKAAAYLSHTTKGEVLIGSLSLRLNQVQLRHVLVRDLHRDTILFTELLTVDFDAAQLLDKTVTITGVELSGFSARMSRHYPDSNYNFSFIAQAFASNDTVRAAKTVNDTLPSEWKFRFGTVKLHHGHFLYDDTGEGIHLETHIGDLESAIDDFDIEKMKLSVRGLSLTNSTAGLVMSEPRDRAEAEPDTTTTEFDLKVKRTDLRNIAFSYKDGVTGTHMNAHIGAFAAAAQHLDLAKQLIQGDLVSLKETDLTYRQLHTIQQPAQDGPSHAEAGDLPWVVLQNKLELENNSLSYDNDNSPRLTQGIDFNHLQVSHLDLSAEQVVAGTEEVKLLLRNMQLSERSGFQLKRFSGVLFYSDQKMSVTAMKLQTGHSIIERDLTVSYPSLSALTTSVALAMVNADINSRIGIGDLRFFAPGLFNDSLFDTHAEGTIRLNLNAEGNLGDMTVRRFDLLSRGLHVQFYGQLKNVTTPSAMYLAIPAIDVSGTRDELLKVLARGLVPSSVNVPDTFRMKGSYTGYLQNFNADIDLYTSAGTLLADIEMDPGAGNVQRPYKGHISADNLNLGYLLKQPGTLGKVSVMADVDGSGFDTSNLDTKVSMTVAHAELYKYKYTNLEMKGHFLKRSFTGSASINDKNIAFDFNGAVDLDPQHTSWRGRLELKGIDFKALHLTGQEIRLSLLLNADMDYVPGQNPTGAARVTNILMIRKERRYTIDSLVMMSANTKEQNAITVQSDVLTAELRGKYLIHQLGGRFVQHLNSYFEIAPGVNDSVYAPQDYAFHFNLVKPRIFTTGLIPGLEQLTPFSIGGSFNSTARSLTVSADLPRVTYNGITVDSLKLGIRSDVHELRYQNTISQVADSTFRFENISLGGIVKGNTATFDLGTARDDSSKVLAIGGKFSKAGDDFLLHLHDGLILNAEPWHVDPLNLMQFGTKTFYAKDVTLTNGDHLLSMNSPEKSLASPLDITFRNFEISTLSRLVEYRPGLLEGKINGFVQLERQNRSSAFKSDIEVRDFVFKSSPIGTVKIKMNNYVDVQKYDLDLQVEGFGNQIGMKGSYHSALKTNNLDLVLDIGHLGLASIEPFTGGEVTRLSGDMEGRLQIKGEPARPRIEGKMHVTNAAFDPRIIGSYLRIPAGDLVFADNKIRLNNLVFYDTLNNQASVSGHVDMADMKNLVYNLRVQTEDFLAMNTSKKSNPLYFGRVFLKSDIRITGTSALPVIDVKAKLNKGSHITYVKPESQVSIDEAKGVVEFTDSLHRYSNIMARRDSSLMDNMTGIELHAIIDVDRSVDIKMIVDPLAGDSLFLKGGGKLDFAMDRSGSTSLTGKYTINEGGYYLTISDFVKRDFKIRKGSSVTWSGDLFDAYVDLDAIYRLKASPIDLVQDQMAGVSELEMNKYRNLLTFDVYLKMTGFISSPEITFDIQLAPEDRGAMNGAVNARLAQLKEDESQMNKQVFALLTLKRFIGENPLESGSEGGFSSASRSSASKVLTQQLSTLSDRYVNFVDLDLGVNSYEDYSSGEQQGRTQLQLGVSKQIFNDRVTVRVGGNVELEGERARQNNANDVAGNISIDYKLTEDGRYKVKAFRENQYENPIEGELTKTGVGFVFTRDFNKFRNLFRKPGGRRDVQEKKK